jgi:hypothetical protein
VRGAGCVCEVPRATCNVRALPRPRHELGGAALKT